MRRRRSAVILVLLATTVCLCAPGPARASFGIGEFSAGAYDQGDAPTQQAGAHPYKFRYRLALNGFGGGERLRSAQLHLPPGFLVNPTSVNECSAAAFATPRSSPYQTSHSGESCPNASQVGAVSVDLGGTTRHFGVFNLAPPFGAPAAIGFSPFGMSVVLTPRLREADSGFDLELDDLPQALDLRSLDLTVWGTPWQPSHDGERGNCLDEESGGSFGSCLVFGNASAPGVLIQSYLTLPTTPCGPSVTYSVNATSWAGEAGQASTSTPPLVACNKALTVGKTQLMTDAVAARTGLVFNLEVNDGGGILNPSGIARPAIKRAIVSLPEGLTINPSVGAGLGSCGEADFAREAIGTEPGAGCPGNSKVGDVTVEGELGLSEPMHGALYIARPHQNPFGSLLAVYMVARLPRRGLLVKSTGAIEAAPVSGRLTATFDQLPRLLYTHFALTLREGQRSVLISPPTCGSYRTDMALSSWAEPDAFVQESSLLPIDQGEAGGPCPSGGLQPFSPTLLAGSINPTPAAYTPFSLRMTRSDGEQEITSYSASFPPGLLARIAGVADCPEGAIEAAKGRTGLAELETPSCPESSRIGHTLAGFGLGGTLAWAPGNLYLAGPYHGAPLSVVAVDSALIGPFDLGTVVVRSAIRIDPLNARASIDSAGSDPIPHILEGIPLHLRDIRVFVDRPGFTVNPTSCDPMRVYSTLTGAGIDLSNPADDPSSTSTQRYQLLGCSGLGFKPRLSLRIAGSTRHGGYPSVVASYRPRAGDANLGAISVALPPALFLAQEHLHTICTRVQYGHSACPPGSVYGEAKAVTPLLEQPLEGPVYLRASDHSVPDLVADLHGRGIEIEVPGRIDSSPKHGIRANFSGLPDAPVTRFTMTLAGGRRGLLANAEDLCRSAERGNARFVGQNNATRVLHPALKTKCRRGGRRKGHKQGGR